MASGNLPPQRREVVVRGDGNCFFYRAIALWNDDVSDEKHKEIRRLSYSLIERNPKVFEPLLFSSNSVEDHVKNSKITGTWGETVDIFSCASLLERPICTFSSSQKKWYNFELIIKNVFVAGVIPPQKEKTQDGDKLYRLWFVLDSTGSVYSAFCRCKGGADQGCRHLGATLFELDDFLSNQRKSVTSLSAYWKPKPTPTLKPVPMSEMKVSQSSLMKKKRKITPYDDSWIDSFDPRPMKGRKEITRKEKIETSKK